MKQFLIIIVLLSSIELKSQEIPAITLFIKDSIKTIHPLIKNEKFVLLMQNKLFNKKIRFKINIKNNSNYDSLIFYFVNREAVRQVPLIKSDTSIIITDSLSFRNNYSQYIDYLFNRCKDAKTPVPNFLKIDTTSIIIDTLEMFNPTPLIINYLNKRIDNNFGITYKIEDEHGNIIRFKHKTPRVYHTIDELEKLMNKRNKKDAKIIKSIKRNLAKGLVKKIIKETKNIKIFFSYRKFRKEFLRERSYIYYNMVPGTYYITFYYTFYLNDNFRSRYTSKFPSGISSFKPIDAIKQDIKDNNIDKSKIFQGEIKSNRVKLIVK